MIGSAEFDRFRALGEATFASTRGGRDALEPFSRARFRALGEAGLFRIGAPIEAGGEGLGLWGTVEALAGFAEGSGDLGLATSALAQMIAVTVLARRSTGLVSERWLRRLVSGEAIACIANAEHGAGTAILGLRARARATADGWAISARKRCITNAPFADVALVSARVRGVDPGIGFDPRRSITCFAVALPAPRCGTRRIELAGLASSPTGDLVLLRSVVPPDALLGDVGEGVALFKEVFALERLFAGALFLAALRRCERRALDLAEAPAASGEPLGRHQHVQERIVQMRVAAELVCSHLRETARAMDAGHDAGPALSAVKVFGIEAAQAALMGLRRLLGSRGLRAADWTARMSEDLAVLAIFGGTVELHKRTLYADLVRERHEGSSASVSIRVVDPPPRGSSLERDLIALVARALPGVERLAGRYTWDAPATKLVIARAGAELVGFRALFLREVSAGSRRVQAIGVGIAVDPAWQRRGMGKLLTAAALAWARDHGHGLALAFLLSPNAERLLRASGFQPLRARVTYIDADGRRAAEQAPCWIAELAGGAIVEAIEACGELDLGRGAF